MKVNIKTLLQPIEYYSNAFPDRKAKVTFDEVSKLLMPRLRKIISFLYDIIPNANTNFLFRYILENRPKTKNNKNQLISSNSSIIYYSGAITQENKKALVLYKRYVNNKAMGYSMLVSYLIKLTSELEFPNQDTSYNDFPEHLFATFNMLCYYYIQEKDKTNIDKICLIIYNITLSYLRKENEYIKFEK